MRLLLERQGRHLLLLVALVGGITGLADHVDAWEGQYRGLSTPTWFGLALGSAVVHQGWVWLCWRVELHTGWLTRTFGPAGFRLYATGFALLVATRFFLLIAVAAANLQTLQISETLLDLIATALLVPIVYLFYSVARYFTFRRAVGIDHFDLSYRTKPLERRGIFRWTRNGMYTFGGKRPVSPVRRNRDPRGTDRASPWRAGSTGGREGVAASRGACRAVAYGSTG